MACPQLQLLICCVALNMVETSRLYHYIRGQSVMKLYVLFNMLQVRPIIDSDILMCSIQSNFHSRWLACGQICDRLFCSFGEDILEAFFGGLRLGKTRLTFHLIVSCIYLCEHWRLPPPLWRLAACFSGAVR